MSLRRRIALRLSNEMAHLGLLRSGFLKHQLDKARGKREAEARVAGFKVRLRPRDSDLATFRTVFSDGEYEVPVPEAAAAIRRHYEEIVARGKTPIVVDAGANIGAATLWFRREFPRAHIIAIEPDEPCCALLRKNVAGDEQISVLEAGIGGSPGHVQIVAAPDSWAIQTERSDSGTPIVTMNELFDSVPNGEPFLAKFNIEGFEEDVFSANLEWLDKVPVVFIEPHDWRFPEQHTSRTFQKAFGDRDFRLFIAGHGICYLRM
jgi:FkbM family methyltransferase